jgi:hypothetical protein
MFEEYKDVDNFYFEKDGISIDPFGEEDWEEEDFYYDYYVVKHKDYYFICRPIYDDFRKKTDKFGLMKGNLMISHGYNLNIYNLEPLSKYEIDEIKSGGIKINPVDHLSNTINLEKILKEYPDLIFVDEKKYENIKKEIS